MHMCRGCLLAVLCRRWTIQLLFWTIVLGLMALVHILIGTYSCAETLEDVCLHENARICVPPLRLFDTKLRSAARFKFAACPIEKSMSTVLTAITCYMHDPEAFTKTRRHIVNDMYENRFCKNKNEYTSTNELLRRNHLSLNESKGWLFLAVVRDPIDRFLSGYADKCIREKKRETSVDKCYKCGHNLTCFIERLHSRAMRYSNGDRRFQLYDDIHFFPQNWHCNFNLEFARYRFVRFCSRKSSLHEQMIDELAAHMIDHGVTETMIYRIVNDLRTTQTQHSTVDSKERIQVQKQLWSRPDLVRRLVQIFYYDYMLFGFNLPTV